MIEPSIKRQFILNGSGVIPSDAGLRSTGKTGAGISKRYAGRQLRKSRPSLVGKGNAARREARRPDGLNRVCTLLKIKSHGCDGKKIIVHDG